MNATIIGATNEVNKGELVDLELFRVYSGKNAGICYMGESYFDSSVTDTDKALKRFDRTVASTHHSIADHIKIEVLFEGISKALAIVLNSLQDYSTSEKSGRYTQMQGNSDLEVELYNKWVELFKNKLRELDPELDDKMLTKLGMENARYLLSVFTRSTTMGYTTSLRQWNYIYDWCEKYLANYKLADGRVMNLDDTLPTYFEEQLYQDFAELHTFIGENLYIQGLRDTKHRYFDFLTKYSGNPNHPMSLYEMGKSDIIADSYCISYDASFVHIAQAERHRTLKYFMRYNPNKADFFVPYFIKDTELEKEWLEDLGKVAYLVPQATMVGIIETGHISDFVLKCEERLCRRAQVEIMRQTCNTIQRFVDNVSNFSSAGIVYAMSLVDSKCNPTTKCKLVGGCHEYCGKVDKALDRLY